MRSARRSSIVIASAMIVAGLASCGTDAPTSPASAGSAALERSNSFTTLAFPGSVQSQAWGIDPSGRVVVGAYRTEDDVVHGFEFASGAFTTIDYPGTTFSLITGINGRGEMVGFWQDANGVQHGYVLQNGVFATVDVPEASSTRIDGINASGDIVGAYDAPDGHSPGFVRRRGKFTAIEPAPTATFTVAKGISSSGDVVGYYAVNNELGEEIERHGFLLRRGNYTIIDFPGSTRTGLSAVNDEGDMFGWYDDVDGHTHAFLLRHGHFSTIDVPGSAFTRGNALNDRGDIVGWYDDVDGVEHGFVQRKRPSGEMGVGDGMQQLGEGAMGTRTMNRGGLVGAAGGLTFAAGLALACTDTPTDPAPTYTVGGTVLGLAGSGVVLRDNCARAVSGTNLNAIPRSIPRVRTGGAKATRPSPPRWQGSTTR